MINLRVAYILDSFPVLSETFIVREILELERKHCRISVFALINSSSYTCSEVIHSDAKKLMDNVHYLLPLSKYPEKKLWFKLILYHSRFFIRNPKRYIKTLLFSVSHGIKIFARFVYSVFYARELLKREIGHIHAHFALESCTFSMLISMLTGISYSFTVHAHDIFIPGLSDLIEYKFNNSKFVACISEYNKQYVLKHFPTINPKKIKVIHCGINLELFNPVTKSVKNTHTILSVGRLVQYKGFKYLIEACKLLKENCNIAFVCNVIGEGKDREQLEDLIDKFNLTGVVNLLGSKEQANVMKTLKSSDLFVLPCIIDETGMRDGIPVALMESMAIGIPVISTKVSGIPELVKYGGGILVEPRDAKELAEAMEKILKLPSEEKDRMCSKARQIIKNEFNLEKEVEKLSALFRNCCI